MLLVRSFDQGDDDKEIPENAYDDSWFRLVNEFTSQTLDYTKIKTLEVPEEFDETPPVDEDGVEGPKNELIYISARIYREEIDLRTGKAHATPKWIYERYN